MKGRGDVPVKRLRSNHSGDHVERQQRGELAEQKAPKPRPTNQHCGGFYYTAASPCATASISPIARRKIPHKHRQTSVHALAPDDHADKLTTEGPTHSGSGGTRRQSVETRREQHDSSTHTEHWVADSHQCRNKHRPAIAGAPSRVLGGNIRTGAMANLGHPKSIGGDLRR